MRVLFLIVLAVAAVTAFKADTKSLQSWEDYKSRFYKKYDNSTEERFRYVVWQQNRAIIDHHNAKEDTTFTMDVNELTDKTEGEIRKRLGVVVPPEVAPISSTILATRQLSVNPSAVDLRLSACMPPVKNQGSCSSCWAFGATCPLEFLTCNKTVSKQPVILSESQLLNGTYGKGNYGCNGGFYTKAWDYVKVAPGLANASALPYYPAASRKCAYTASMKVATLSSYVQIRAKDTVQIMQSVANQGPLAAGMVVLTNSLPYYRSGIYSDPACPNTGASFNHAVVIVGYGTSNGTNYWIVRNSWGPNWGDQGYFLIQRGVNMCNIESLVYFVNM